jgi:hypothetical protein
MSGINDRDTLLGRDATLYLGRITPVVNFLTRTPVKYEHMANDVFQHLLKKDPPRGMQIYWSELLGRAHFAASASMIRSFQWCQGILSSDRDSLFLPYCASFRGLLESIADTYDALNNVAITLAQHHAPINQCLQGTSSFIMCSEELEDQLIHFSYARKLEKGEVAPTSHRAKTAADCLAQLSLPNGLSARELYAELCQFTHPAAHSVHYLLIQANDNSAILFGQGEKSRVRRHAQHHEAYFLPLLMLGFNPGFLVLKVLQSLKAAQYHVPIVDDFNIDNIPAWKRMEAYLAAC